MRLPPPIASASHPLARQARSLDKGVRERRDEGLFLVEGPRGVAEALDAGADLVWVLVASGRAEREPFASLALRCLDAAIPVQPVRDAILEKLAPAEHGPGLLGACRLPRDADRADSVIAKAKAGFAVVTWGIQDPGNLGTLVRSALAFGATGFVAVEGADPWSPKAVRASAGAIHRLPVARGAADDDPCGRLLDAGVRLVAAVAVGGQAPEKIDWRGPVALVLGAEVRGLPDDIVERATVVTIAISPAVESLSVAIAGSILLAQAAARRRSA